MKRLNVVRPQSAELSALGAALWRALKRGDADAIKRSGANLSRAEMGAVLVSALQNAARSWDEDIRGWVVWRYMLAGFCFGASITGLAWWVSWLVFR